MLEYTHLSIKIDLKKAIGEVKEACENIQRTTEHVRLCLSFAQEMYSQLYALGKEIHVRGIPDPFQMRRSKRKFGDAPETYSEMLEDGRKRIMIYCWRDRRLIF